MADCKIPEIPFASGVDQNLQRILSPIKETLDIWAGRAGDSLCRHVTIEDLLDEAVTVNITGGGGSYAPISHTHVEVDITDLGTYQVTSEKSAANGYASLGATTLVPTAELGTGSATTATFLRGDQSWQTVAAGSDEQIKVSSNDTTAGYLEDKFLVAHGTNTTNPLELSTLNDGLDEDRQLQFDESKVDHDQLLNFLAAEHIDWALTGAEDIHVDRITAGAITQHVGSIDHNSLLNTHNLTTDIDHDQLTNFAAGEHTDAQVKASLNDTTPGYLEDKIVVASGTNTTNILELSTLNDGLNEDVQIQIDEAKINHANLLNLAVGDPHTQYQLESEKGSANGYAGLGAGGYVPTAQLGSGTATASNFLRGDQSWQTVLITDELLKVSANDTTAGYLEDKIVLSSGANTTNILELSTLNDGLDEDVQIQIDEAKINHANLLNLAVGDPHTQYQLESEKSAANGYASLGAATLVPTGELGTGTADNTTFLRGDQTWQASAGGGLFIETGTNIVGGTNAGSEISSGGNNFYGGVAAGRYGNGSYNIAIGNQALEGTTLNDYTRNVGIGYQCGLALTTGSYNILIGGNAATALIGSSNNIAIGDYAFGRVTNGGSNVVIGDKAGYGLSGGTAWYCAYNVVIGRNAMTNMVTAEANVVAGYGAGYHNQTGDHNVFVGRNAGYGVLGTNNPNYSVVIGSGAGLDLINANYNTLIGYGAGGNVSTGASNICIGAAAGDNITTGGNNISIGYYMDPLVATDSYQFALGHLSYPFLRGNMNTYQLAIYGANGYLNFNTTLGSTGYGFRDNAGTMEFKNSAGSWAAVPTGGALSEDGVGNLTAGTNAGSELSTGADNFYAVESAGRYGNGNYNVGIGYRALEGTTLNNFSSNVGIGLNVGVALTTGGNNVLIGSSCASALASGGSNVLIGPEVGQQQTTASYEVLIGYRAGQYKQNGSSNVVIGAFAGLGVTAVSTYSSSVLIGKSAGQDLTTAVGNVFVGNTAGYNDIAGSSNVAVGNQSFYYHDAGTYNVFLGSQAAYGYSGPTGWACSENVGIGAAAMQRAVTVSRSVSIGRNSGYYNETGDYNVFVGYDTGRGVTGTNNPSFSVAVGYFAGRALINSTRNTLLGNKSGEIMTTGNDNTCLGDETGNNITTGSDNIVIGANIDPLSATANNQFALGNDTYPFLRGEMNNYILAIYGANGYLNFNTTLGSTGYGIRDNSGVIEAKDTGGSWQPITTGEGILTTNSTYRGKTLTVVTDDASAVFGNALYCAADFHYERADASATTTMPCRALAVSSGTGTKEVLLEGQICNTTWAWTAGDIYVSATTGALTQTAPAVSGDQVQKIGWALSADTIYFKPDSTIVEVA